MSSCRIVFDFLFKTSHCKNARPCALAPRGCCSFLPALGTTSYSVGILQSTMPAKVKTVEVDNSANEGLHPSFTLFLPRLTCPFFTSFFCYYRVGMHLCCPHPSRRQHRCYCISTLFISHHTLLDPLVYTHNTTPP